jgi:hypothetical protein
VYISAITRLISAIELDTRRINFTPIPYDNLIGN